MAKDRFKKRDSYDPTYKFNEYVKSVSKERGITSEQVILMKEMYKRDTISNWDRRFIKGCLGLDNLSGRQKTILRGIYLKSL